MLQSIEQVFECHSWWLSRKARVPLGQAVHAHLTSPAAMSIHYSVGAEYSNLWISNPL